MIRMINENFIRMSEDNGTNISRGSVQVFTGSRLFIKK